jgi:hypothetical protein
MSDPWDIPPIPTKGDDDDSSTYAGIGMVISEWERIEVELSDIYGMFVGVFGGDTRRTMREYGEPRIFEERIKGLLAKAERYFQRYPHQEKEGAFCKIVCIARKFAARRGDLAHCVVTRSNWWPPPDIYSPSPVAYCAVPPHYAGKKFDPNNMPTYVYTSKEMIELAGGLYQFCEEIAGFKWQLIYDERARRGEPRLPGT